MGGVVRTIKKFVKKVVKTVVNVVQKAVSWLTPSFPSFDASFGDTPMDNYEQGLLLNKQSNDASIPVIYGERLVGGTRVFLDSGGGNTNQYLYMAIVLAEGEINSIEEINDDLNYSFLSRTFSSLSKIQKDKILQILNNTSKFEKVG